MVPALTFSIFSLRTSSCSDCRLSSALQKGSRWKLLSLSAFKKRQMVTKPIDFGFPPSPALTGWRQQRSDRVFQPPAPGPSFSHFLRGKFSSPKDRSLPGNISRSDVRFTQSIDSFHVFFSHVVFWLPKAFHPPTRKNGKKNRVTVCKRCSSSEAWPARASVNGASNMMGKSQTIVADLDTTEDSAKLK